MRCSLEWAGRLKRSSIVKLVGKSLSSSTAEDSQRHAPLCGAPRMICSAILRHVVLNRSVLCLSHSCLLHCSWLDSCKHLYLLTQMPNTPRRHHNLTNTIHHEASLIGRIFHVHAHGSPSTALLRANLGVDCQRRGLATFDARMADTIVQRYHRCEA